MIHIDAEIGREFGQFSSNNFRAQMPPTFEPLTIRIHSEGGSVFEAFSICDMILGHNGETTAVVSSAAFSAASLIAAVCDNCHITKNGYFLLHSPRMDQEEISDSEASLLVSLEARMVAIYQSRTRQSANVIRQMLADETFLSAEESHRFGLADKVLERASFSEMPAHAVALMRKSKPLPKSIKRQVAKSKWTAAVDAAKATGKTYAQAVKAVDKTHPGLRLEFVAEVNNR